MKNFFLTVLACFFTSSCFASLLIHLSKADPYGEGHSIGTVQLDDTIYGLLLTPHLKELPPGAHGFAIYTVASCDNYANAAGGHYDPDRSFQHRGPYHGDGHFGDLPVLVVDATGHATLPVLAPRLKLADVYHRSLIVIAGGDNYSDEFMRLNNSKRRIACGVIPYFN